MPRSGRVWPALPDQSPRIFPLLIFICAHITTTASIDYGVPIEIKLWDTGRTPLAHMVDVTNGFGLKVLAEHNFLNDNNIAFSPYGLMGIVVALYEGVDGESSYQIQRGMQLPWNRNVMRIGFRDIHRTLKTYFVPEEGFLAGLALNNENVTFNESYKKILRFYGFDLDNDQLPTLPPQVNSTSDATTTVLPTNPAGSDSASTTVSPTSLAGSDSASTTVAMTTESKPAREDVTTTSTRPESTTNPNSETVNDIDIRTPVETSTVSPSSAPNAESTTMNSVVQITEPSPTTERITIETTTQAPTTITTMQTIPLMPDTEPTTAVSSSIMLEETTTQNSQATMASTDEPTSNNEVDTSTTTNSVSNTAELTTATSTAPPAVTTSETQTESTMTTSMSQRQETEPVSTTIADMTTAPLSTTVLNESNLETLERRKKSIVDFIFTNPPYVGDYLYYRSFDIGSELPSYDDKMFLVNGLKNVQVTYMHYDTVLEHAYLPHLEASALRLPLDSDRYYLLVVLPLRGGGAELSRLLTRMARESDLSDIYAALRPRRVRATVPSFTVKGHITLTTDLQKLGIRDVFEPRQRDFTPMTRQSGVYVRSIEQAVSVAIRKYRPDDLKKNRYVTNRDPVTFSATYPFLYFVMDANIHVSLMAGKMVDPLNSRIL